MTRYRVYRYQGRPRLVAGSEPVSAEVDFEDVCRLDEAVLGAPRRVLLRRLFDDNPEECAGVVHRMTLTAA